MNGDLNDNEQAEIHFFVNTAAPVQCNSPRMWHVSVDYEVSSEVNYDWLWINSTGSQCGDAGVVRKKVSGSQSGNVQFQLPAGCSAAWVGIYYIKDYSVSTGEDVGKIKNVRIYPELVSCTCPCH